MITPNSRLCIYDCWYCQFSRPDTIYPRERVLLALAMLGGGATTWLEEVYDRGNDALDTSLFKLCELILTLTPELVYLPLHDEIEVILYLSLSPSPSLPLSPPLSLSLYI